jgi:hypothetical protein
LGAAAGGIAAGESEAGRAELVLALAREQCEQFKSLCLKQINLLPAVKGESEP